jgi:hypothetical protein
MTRRIVALVGALAVAAPSFGVSIANPASDRLAQLDDIPRRAALRGALLDSGMQCTRVEAAARQGPWGNLIMWRAKCHATDPRFDYGVFLGPDGSVQARRCTEMTTLKLPPCRPLVRRSSR